MNPGQPWVRIALFGIFVFSGLSGLIYESIWAQYLKLILGHAAYAQSLVLVIFMGGMAVGAYFSGKLSSRISRPLKVYALLELLIGLAGLGFHQLFVYSYDLLFDSLIPGLGSGTVVMSVKIAWCSALILLPSILLGATFPILSLALLRSDPGRAGYTLGMLYATNSLGAVIGVLLSSIYLVEAVGLPGTILCAAVVNILIAGIVWLLPEPGTGSLESDSDAVKDRRQPLGLGPVVGISLVIALFTGMASFIYEIAWIRMLSLVLGSTNHSFELMLAAFILGLALGGWWIRSRIDGLKQPLAFLGWVQVAMALFAMLTIPAYLYSFEFMAVLLKALARNEHGYVLYLLFSLSISLFVMLPTTFCAGMTLPLITRIALVGSGNEGVIGRIYAFNTLGAIIGVVLATNVLMAWVGVKWLIVCGAGIDLLLGIYLLARTSHSSAEKLYPAGAAIAFGMAVWIVATVFLDPLRIAGGVYRTGATLDPETVTTLFHEDGKTATVSLFESRSGARFINTNGKTDARIHAANQPAGADELTMAGLAAIPLAVHPDPKRVAVIGFGAGSTTHVLLGSERVTSVDTIEIEEKILHAARYFGEFSQRAYEDSRSHLHIDDAKTYFSNTQNRYDLIISEPSNPWVSGIANLFSREFYRDINRYLVDGGVFGQWLQLYETDTRNIASVIKAISAEFVDYAVYATDYGNLVILGSNRPLAPARADPLFESTALSHSLARVGVHHNDDLNTRLLGTRRTMDRFFASVDAPINSDFFPFLSHHSARTRFYRVDATGISDLFMAPFPLAEGLGRTSGEYRVSTHARNPLGWRFQDAGRVLKAIHHDGGVDGISDSGLVAATYQVRDWTEACDARQRESQLINSLLYLVRATIPFVSRDQAMLLANSLEDCAEQTTLELGRWIRLFRAVAAEDGGQILHHAERLLDEGGITVRNPGYEYVQGAVLYSALHGASPEAVKDVLRQYPLPYASLAATPPYLRWMLMQAEGLH